MFSLELKILYQFASKTLMLMCTLKGKHTSQFCLVEKIDQWETDQRCPLHIGIHIVGYRGYLGTITVAKAAIAVPIRYISDAFRHHKGTHRRHVGTIRVPTGDM